MDDIEVRASISQAITDLLMLFDDPKKVVAVYATSMKIWSELNNEDILAVSEMLIDAIQTAHGLEIEGGTE